MKVSQLLLRFALALLGSNAVAARALGGKPTDFIINEERALQDIVTWDEHSLFVHGKRVNFWGGEFHPFRLPVPSLWLDVFQKIRAMGYNGVSFYSAWVLHEPKPGHFSAEGLFDWEPYFEAAKKAGIYLVARPGPYINAEVHGGGFPGWLQRISGNLRTPDADYQAASKHYIESITPILAKAQITNGGPIVLFQPENEYSMGMNNVTFPDASYMNGLMKQFRDLGIVVPFINNVAWPSGINAPGTDAPVDIYGHNSYPLGMDCSDPKNWLDGALPTDWRKTHLEQSPNTPYLLVEYQAGAYQPWGGDGFDKCAEFTNEEFERVFYKNNIAVGATISNFYMTFGGTNWGNLGHADGYTSYDYGAAITEERQVHREKYSEAKLIANFVAASGDALASATPGYNITGVYADNGAVTVTPLIGEKTKFFVARQTKYNSLDSVSYKLRLPTSAGNITVPQLGGTLSLNGRDSKIHVTDYPVGDYNLLYSSAEVFTWKKHGSRTTLVVYGGPNEHHELAVSKTSGATSVEGSGIKFSNRNGNTILNWESSPNRRTVRISTDLYIIVLDRNSAYDYWTVSTDEGSYSHELTPSSELIVKAGYLLRTASISDGKIHLTGDINATTTVEVVAGAHEKIKGLTFNSADVKATLDRNGFLKSSIAFTAPKINLPDLSTLPWHSIDTLPELLPDYDDSSWVDADHTNTNNTYWPLTTPTVLWGAEYGFHAGSLLTRGHFTATGNESVIHLNVSGGSAFAFSAWVNNTFLGSWDGAGDVKIANLTLNVPKLVTGEKYVLTVLSDHMGHNGNWFVGYNEMKTPRGIIGYSFPGHTPPSSNGTSRAPDGLKWKITGNLGGEDFHGGPRGSLNEGALWIERNGFHLPSAPTSSWKKSIGPTTVLETAGVAFYTAIFDLEIPSDIDLPLSFAFDGDAFDGKGKGWRAQLWVNGYQFGKFANGIGPQRRFPVPQGILNYSGENTLGVSIWALEEGGAKPEGFEIVAGMSVESGYGEVKLSPMDGWEKREGVY
ncbi:uncharacterized protein N0V89_002174 [Didymosphaeria variabile]|uniref:Beta-galactosidase n=1 Tax=Didymosphaeria variabile TaxID=1932322 RepID=A0A9W8XT04_9PLEO|nr:uncharacterized protein N0V89_002174 [Didymosphaeria variabile]KAJ4357598.1 hypothetical protein N0V89_002174 [Didymosphaeria variabile]